MGIDISDWLAMEARLRRKQHPDGTGCEDEGELHDFIIEDCRRRGWAYLHGSMAHRTRRTPGEFDFIVLADKGRVLFVECKDREGKLSKEQQELHAHAAKLGHMTWVIRSPEEWRKLANFGPSKFNPFLQS